MQIVCQITEIWKNIVCSSGSGIFNKDRCRAAAENVTEVGVEEGIFHGTIVVFCTSTCCSKNNENHNSDWLNDSKSVYCFTNLEIPYWALTGRWPNSVIEVPVSVSPLSHPVFASSQVWFLFSGSYLTMSCVKSFSTEWRSISILAGQEIVLKFILVLLSIR